MEIDSRTGLVLEGGGMRAIFTVGVLDCFMDRHFVCLPAAWAFPVQQYRPAGKI